MATSFFSMCSLCCSWTIMYDEKYFIAKIIQITVNNTTITAKIAAVIDTILWLCSCLLTVFQVDVDNNIKLLTQKNVEIAEVVSKLESESSDLDIDEAVVTTAPLYNQWVRVSFVLFTELNRFFFSCLILFIYFLLLLLASGIWKPSKHKSLSPFAADVSLLSLRRTPQVSYTNFLALLELWLQSTLIGVILSICHKVFFSEYRTFIDSLETAVISIDQSKNKYSHVIHQSL